MAIYVYGGGGTGGGGGTWGSITGTLSDQTDLNTALSGKAATALSNLASVAINTTLVSDTDNTDDLGTTSIGWRSGYFGTSVISPLLTASAGTAIGVTATAPAQATTSTAGTAASLTASAAVAGSSVNGAAAGGDVTIKAGAAARLVSGNANGGNVNLVTGAGIGTGTTGQVLIPTGSTSTTAPTVAFSGDTNSGISYQAADAWGFVRNGALALYMNSLGNRSDASFYPNTANAKDLGITTASSYWRTAYLQTSIQGSNSKALTETTATGFVKITTASSAMTGGRIRYSVVANDGTDFQSRSGEVMFSIVDKAGTAACTLGTVVNEAFVETAGASTLTVSFDTSISGHDTTIRANATSSLSQSTLNILYFVELQDVATVTAL